MKDSVFRVQLAWAQSPLPERTSFLCCFVVVCLLLSSSCLVFIFYSKLCLGMWVYMHACQRFGEPEALATLQLELGCELSDVAAGD